MAALERLGEGLLVEEALHQHLTGHHVLDDGRHQAIYLLPVQLAGIKLQLFSHGSLLLDRADRL